MECSFEIDQETASRWNFPPSSNHPSEAATKAQELKTNLHLQICCLPRIVVDSMMEEMTSGATIQDLAMATSQIENHWPTTGHLIIKVNPQSKIARTWLPHELKPTSPPVLIQNCVRQGINTVQFIQLSGMSEHVFVLFAIEKPSHPDDGGFVVPPVQKTSDRDSFNFGPSKVSVTLIDREGHPIG
ncbi:hypothetical protein B0H34DRAFT_666460 [Crassisporium funariophilum]|nr:hypothetical protein B0H34DRAFT_666460 [Crassisporium funariophilum]